MLMSHKNKRCLLAITGAYHTDGGIAAVNRLMIKAIAEEGYALDIFSLVEENTSVDNRYLPSNAKVCSQAFAGNKYLFTLAVWQTILKSTYDFVFVDHVNLASILAPLIWMKRHQYIVWLFGVEVFPPRPDWEGWLGLHLATKRLAISEFTKQSVIHRFPKLSVEVCDLSLDPVRHGIVHTSQSPIAYEPIVLQAVNGNQAALNKEVILHVGRMVTGERFKGQDSLIQAFSMIHKHHPGAQLVLAGQGNDMNRLKDMAKALPDSIQARIFFPGYVPDDLLAKIYQSCYVFAMPSAGEGFGLVYLEAMLRGVPCIGGNLDATPYLVRDGVTGLLVDNPRSPAQVASALNWFLSHPGKAQEMGEHGKELVNSYYLFPHFQERFWKAVKN